MSGRVHLNTAGAGIPAPAVPAVMADHLVAEAELGPYEAEARRADDLEERVYARLAELVGARREEIALFGSATDAWCRIVGQLDLPAGGRLWVTPYEYAGNLIALQRLAVRRGCVLEVVPTLPGGDLDLDWFAANLDDRVALVSLTHMPSGMGTVLPVAEVGALLAGSAAVYVVDACQTVGQLTVDTAARFETAERNNAVVLGLLAAADHALTDGGPAAPQVYDALVSAVRETPGTRLLAPGSRRAGILSFVHESCSPERLRAGLADDGVSVWVGVGAHTPLWLAASGIDRFVRTSVHHYNTPAEIEEFRSALRRVLR